MIPVSAMTWPIEATRTPNSACVWIAEATVEGRTNTARSRHGAANELARHLVAAGLADRPMVIRHHGLAGTTTYPSFHAAAMWTFGEGERTLRRIRYRQPPEGVFLGSGTGQKCVHRRWPVTWRACRPTDVKRRRRRRPSRSVQLFPVLRGRAALLRANQIGAMETSRGAKLTGSKRTLPLARILIQPMQAFYCCIVCITVIDAERD
jgi:hypothetical protein